MRVELVKENEGVLGAPARRQAVCLGVGFVATVVAAALQASGWRAAAPGSLRGPVRRPGAGSPARRQARARIGTGQAPLTIRVPQAGRSKVRCFLPLNLKGRPTDPVLLVLRVRRA